MGGWDVPGKGGLVAWVAAGISYFIEIFKHTPTHLFTVDLGSEEESGGGSVLWK